MLDARHCSLALCGGSVGEVPFVGERWRLRELGHLLQGTAEAASKLRSF